jgi:hypothetical protein
MSKDGLVTNILNFPGSKNVVPTSLLANPVEIFEKLPRKSAYCDYQTPDYNKQKSDMMGSSVTLESDIQILEQKVNRQKVGNDLKLQWTEMMKEFEQGSKRQIRGMSPVAAQQHD